ncbi:nicotinamide-nucleotide amidohydrolase family protein [Rhodocyclus tenuis]|uniref:CinA family protein n=1 Tax=Rhodocyclus gracilis TaxID=2929842 RepID=UPI001298AD14|nr:CinA family protein [Rhodocyclus gracilis]MRD73437.1 nicotinamide-nucleotide amidohydrolase family protein [Rhodocyclus gracilis]
MHPNALELLAARVGEQLLQRDERLALAESCTGGWVAQCVTAIAGSSRWFDRGFVTYSNAAKMEMLGVDPATLSTHGAVSEATALAMADGALAHSPADWAIAISGIAGPEGGTPAKPVGTVCFAWAHRDGRRDATTQHFAGDREAVRAASVASAFGGLLERCATLSA